MMMRALVTEPLAMMLISFVCCHSCVAQSSATQPKAEQSSEAKGEQQGDFEKTTIPYRHALRDWERVFANTPANKPPSSSDAQTLAGKLFVDLSISWPTHTGDVCSAGFFRIAGSRGYSLVATYDVNGRRFCNGLTVVHRNPDGLSAYSADTWEVDDVADVIGEVEADGRGFLIFPVPFSDYEGANSCMAFWMRIYSFNSGVLVNRDSDLKGYYRKLLHRLTSEDMQKAKKSDADDNRDEAVCIQMEVDKINRFLGIFPDAGKAAALRWLRSKNVYMRNKGMAVLTDIGDLQSIAAAQQAALDWIERNDRSQVDGEMWLVVHGDQQAIATYQAAALKWLRSGDKKARNEGLDSLVSIGPKLSLDQSAIDLVRKFAQDSDENVAAQARMILNEAGIPRH